jgi:hypothetical protein
MDIQTDPAAAIKRGNTTPATDADEQELDSLGYDRTSDHFAGTDEFIPTDADWAAVNAAADEAAAREFLDTGDRLTLAELVDRQADFYRSWVNPAGAMIAGHLEQLAMAIRWCHAETPEEYDARHEVIERDARETWFRQGFEAGRRALPYSGPLD